MDISKFIDILEKKQKGCVRKINVEIIDGKKKPNPKFSGGRPRLHVEKYEPSEKIWFFQFLLPGEPVTALGCLQCVFGLNTLGASDAHA